MTPLYAAVLYKADRNLSVKRLTKAGKQYERWLYTVLLGLTVGATPLMAFTQSQLGFGLALGLLLVASVIVLMARWPVLGFFVLASCAVVVEQDLLPYPIFTDHLYVFYWPTQLQGLPERPIGFVLIFVLLLVIVRRVAGRAGAPLRVGPLIVPFLFLIACVVIGVAHGLSSGGSFRIIVLEVRPFWYLFLNYLLAYNLITEKWHVIGFLWVTVLGTFIKALQGVYIVMGPLGGHISGQNEIMAHEQSFFFVLVLLIIVMSLLLQRLRGLMWVALISTPFLIIALLANNRRADYAAFLIGALAAWLMAIAMRPDTRKTLIAALIICALIFGAYVLAFQHSTGSFAEPAHAVMSIIKPSASDLRDQSSNLYRYIEDFDLKYTEKQSPILGYGFGREFLQPMVLPNIISLDPYYLYIPHNTILWVWMRLGPIGYAALFYLVGAFVVRSGILARTLRDRDLQYVAIFGVAVMFIELPLAYGDYQLFFYRNIFYLGLLMGMLMRLPDIDKKSVPDTETPARLPRGSRALAPLATGARRAGAPSVPTVPVLADASEVTHAEVSRPYRRISARAGGYLRATLARR